MGQLEDLIAAVLETLAGRETTVLGSTESLDPAENTANYDSTVRKVSWGFGEWEYLALMCAAAVVVVVAAADWVSALVMAGFAIDVEVFGKAMTATG